MRLGLLVFVLAACSSSREVLDGGVPDDDASDSGFDAGPWIPPVCPNGEAPVTGCNVPDESCPEEHPHPGGPCVGALVCQYRELGGAVDTIFTYTCEESEWRISGQCDAEDPYYYDYESCDLTPPLLETCDAPFDGTIDGALVEVGPASATEPFRPYEPYEPVSLIGGGQGASMMEIRIRIGCVEAPECVFVRTTIEILGDAEPTVSRIALHCGESLSVWVIVGAPCDDEREFADAEVTVEIPGIGTAEAIVQVPSSSCDYG